MFPKDLKFTKTHEWIRLENEVATLGISGYAVEQLGDIVYVELPDQGSDVSKEQPFGAIESVKAASDLYSPVDGTVAEANNDLENDYNVFKDDTYGSAWIVKIKVSEISQVDDLMDADEYEKFVNSQQ
jgi:glycine cleavage system H protein